MEIPSTNENSELAEAGPSKIFARRGGFCLKSRGRRGGEEGGDRMARRIVAAVLAACLLCSAAGGFSAEEGVEEDRRLILVTGEVIDTRRAPQIPQWGAGGGGERRDGGRVSQWYIHVEDDADVTNVEREGGMKMGSYVPHNTYTALGTRSQALKTREARGVLWVGVRPERHKIAEGLGVVLEDRVEQRRRAADDGPDHHRLGGGFSRWFSLFVRRALPWNWRWRGGDDESAEARAARGLRRQAMLGRRQQLFVLLVPPEERSLACTSRRKDASCHGSADHDELAELFNAELEEAGINARLSAASEVKLLADAASVDAVADLVEYLANRPEVHWIEHKIEYQPFASGATRIMRMGPDQSNKGPTARETVANQQGLMGKGQTIGIADTGIDWDNCLFWEPGGSAVSPEEGQPPPFKITDKARRKIIGYEFETDCSVCGRCAVDIEEDSVRLGVTNGLIEAGQKYTTRFPADEALSAIAPRSYDAAGASISYDIKANTQGVPSQYISQGAGSVDIPVEIQMFILKRSDTDSFDVANPDYSKCLNGDLCRQALNRLQAVDLQLPAAQGGYGVIIANRGLSGLDAALYMQGNIQLRRAIKPCGDEGDDRSGHGTHLSGLAAGGAFAPAGHEEEVIEAGEYNGMAPEAQIYFTDLMQNADPACNNPDLPCSRVSEMSVPVDVNAQLFPKPYAAGARVHLDSWGCSVPPGESPHYCNNYTTHSMEIDQFSWAHKDFLVVTAVGDTGIEDAVGTIHSPSTCKNCLSVGSTLLWNDEYRKNVIYRNPLDDVCEACQFPSYCSRSGKIGGVTITDENRYEKIQALPSPCCNDTTHVSWDIKDVLIPPRQMWTVAFPNMSTINAGAVSSFVSALYNWRAAGASIHYNVTAETTALQQSGDPKIQVFVLNRKDYMEYFESETASCLDDATFAGCRKNPCTSIESKQVDGTEACFSVDANAGYTYRAAAGSGLECAYNTYGGVSYQDAHCHIGKCTRGAARTLKWTEGCPTGVDQCCNDKFLQTYCLNQPCTEIGRRASNIVRHTTETANADLGYGIMIRNMGEQTIKVNGKVSIHNKEYPCTLLDCCRTGSKCCSSLYKMPFGTQGTCNVCPRFYEPGECEISDHSVVLKESSRGPAMGSYNLNQGGVRYKPDLVAPGHMVVSAKSDGNRMTDGLRVQCGLRPAITFDDENSKCNVAQASDPKEDVALAGKTGSSVSAALVAGAALIIREYLASGYYPDGVKDSSNKAWANPSASLVRAMLVNSARTAGGTVNVYTYQKEPPCLSETGECAPWVQPPPAISTRSLRDASGNWLTPNYYEGFGRPVLSNVLNFAGTSDVSLWIKEGQFSQAGMMDSYEFPLLRADWATPLKVTLAWTDPPATLGAADLLVNDLDLIVQLSTIVTRYDINLGLSTTKQTFVIYKGNIQNSGGNSFTSTVSSASDSSNTLEEVVIQNPTDATNVTVIVVSKRLSSLDKYKPQPYSLVVTGQIRPYYHSWNSSKSQLLGIVGPGDAIVADTTATDAGLDRGFDFLDVFKTSRVDARNLRLKLLVGDALSVEMIGEADEDNDGVMVKSEYIKLMRTLRLGNRRPRDPRYTTGKASPSLLGTANAVTVDSFSMSPPRSVAGYGPWLFAAASVILGLARARHL